ncbi:MAG: hypothetical protein KAQ62_14880 [Cyclobacteriaceae bacterium]|nr:hypothetical protein [Cyclobacteriaceae bacterium]
MAKFSLLFLLFSLCFSEYTNAHGDIHERIVKTTKEIKNHPDSAYLYVKRGKLYFQHEDFNKSISDLKTSQKLGYYSNDQQLLFAKAHAKLDNYLNALNYVDVVLKAEQNSVIAIRLKANILYKQHKYKGAALAFERVLQISKETFPENYIEASLAWEMLNTEEGDNNALAIIQKGIDELGNIISLYYRLIELSIHKKDYEAAIKVQNKIIEFSPRKETAYYKLAELQLCNNKKAEALESLTAAKAHFNKLPARIQNTSFMREFMKNINTKETQLNSN